MFSIQGLTYHISGNLILDDVNLQINANQHAGLVGRNGSGKTTLFKIILKEAEFDAGKIAAESGIKIRSVRQEIPSGEITPREFLLRQDTERNELMLQLENSSDNPEKIAEIYERLIQINAFDAEARAAVILNGLGFDEEAQNKPLNTFSGGFLPSVHRMKGAAITLPTGYVPLYRKDRPDAQTKLSVEPSGKNAGAFFGGTLPF